MKNIQIKYYSGGSTLYTSFTLNSLSQIVAVQDGCYLYFTSVFTESSLTSSRFYYGTIVYFSKTDYGYQLFSEVISSIQGLVTNPERTLATIDFSFDPSVSVTFSNMMGISTGG